MPYLQVFLSQLMIHKLRLFYTIEQSVIKIRFYNVNHFNKWAFAQILSNQSNVKLQNEKSCMNQRNKSMSVPRREKESRIRINKENLKNEK